MIVTHLASEYRESCWTSHDKKIFTTFYANFYALTFSRNGSIVDIKTLISASEIIGLYDENFMVMNFCTFSTISEILFQLLKT